MALPDAEAVAPTLITAYDEFAKRDLAEQPFAQMFQKGLCRVGTTDQGQLVAPLFPICQLESAGAIAVILAILLHPHLWIAPSFLDTTQTEVD